MQKSSNKLEEQVAYGFRRVLVRPPVSSEVNRLAELYQQLKSDIDDPVAFLAAAQVKEGDPSMVALASVLFNLDETLMKP